MKKFKYQTGKAKEEMPTPTGPPTPTKFEKPVFKKSEKVNHRAIKSMINDQGDIQSAKTGGKMLKRADGSYSQRGLWDNIRANKGSGKKPTKEMLKQEKKIKSKKYLVGGPENPSPKPTPVTGPTMSFQDSLKEYMSGKMTADQARAASGVVKKPKKYTDEQNIDNLKKVFVGSHKVDAQGNVVPKKTGGTSNWLMESKELMFGGSTDRYGNSSTSSRRTGGKKKRMGGKNC